LQPDAGEVRVLGLEPSRQRHELAFRVGTVFGQRSQLWYQLPPRDTFALLGRVYEIAAAEHRRRLDALTAAFGLGAILDTPVRQLSLGERVRCEMPAEPAAPAANPFSRRADDRARRVGESRDS